MGLYFWDNYRYFSISWYMILHDNFHVNTIQTNVVSKDKHQCFLELFILYTHFYKLIIFFWKSLRLISNYTKSFGFFYLEKFLYELCLHSACKFWSSDLSFNQKFTTPYWIWWQEIHFMALNFRYRSVKWWSILLTIR